jgi:hypothetical protein
MRAPLGVSGGRVGQDVDPHKEARDGEVSLAGEAIHNVERNPALPATQPFGDGARPQAELLRDAVFAGRLAAGGQFAFDGFKDDGERFQEHVFGRAGDVHES